MSEYCMVAKTTKATIAGSTDLSSPNENSTITKDIPAPRMWIRIM
jgi:hypothetical protein